MALMKKGEITLVVALTAFLASTVVLVAFYGVVLPGLKEMSDKELCMLSVQAKYAAGAVKGKEALINLQCYTQTLEIKRDGIYKSGKKRKPKLIDEFSGDDDYTRIEKVQEAIANEMFDCWDQFHEGKLPMFYEKEKRCVICADIVFHSDWLDSGGDKYVIIGWFLNNYEIPGRDIKYSTFFGGRFDSNFTIDPTQKTQVVFKGLEGPEGQDTGRAAAQAVENWRASMVIGPSVMVGGGSCDRLY